MPSKTNTPDAPQSAKTADAPSTSTAVCSGTNHESTTIVHQPIFSDAYVAALAQFVIEGA